jgi:hypothetical protein
MEQVFWPGHNNIIYTILAFSYHIDFSCRKASKATIEANSVLRNNIIKLNIKAFANSNIDLILRSKHSLHESTGFTHDKGQI